jgi:hypothetical protein
LQRHSLMLESKDLEYLLASPTDSRCPTQDLSVAYQGGSSAENAGPIVLHKTTPEHYSSTQSPELPSEATAWEVLTLRLGRFARLYIEKHGVGSITDDMLQREARRVLYDDPEDPWNQTAADNAEWLSLFKKAHGIDTHAQVEGMSEPSSCGNLVCRILIT